MRRLFLYVPLRTSLPRLDTTDVQNDSTHSRKKWFLFTSSSHSHTPFFSLFLTKFPFLSTHFSSNSPSDSPLQFFPPSICSIFGTPRLVSPLLLACGVFCPSRLVLHTSPDMFVSCDPLSQARGVLFHNSVSTQFLIYAAAQFLIICSLASSVGRASAF